MEVNITELNPGDKWRMYFRTKSIVKYKNLVPFSYYAQAVRGIATGSNSYFLFSREKQEKFGIPDSFFMHCISKSNQAVLPFFTEEEFHTLLHSGGRVLLFNGKDGRERNVKKYIQAGEEKEVNMGYLTSRRNPWYRIEKREPSPIWAGTFHRKSLRFVRNEAGVYNLTAFHCVYLSIYARKKINVLFAYLLTDTAMEIFSRNAREYGKGLKKLEPNDLNSSRVVNHIKIDEKSERTIEDIYDNYRESVLSGYPKGTLLGDLNDIFLKILKT